MYKDKHYPKCEEQPEDQPCICNKIEEEAENAEQDISEAEATEN